MTGPLCNRAASLVNLGQRFGQSAVTFVNFLENFCGRSVTDPPGGDTTSCTWPIGTGNILRITPHMHLLGQGMKVVLNPGTPTAQTLLNVTNYDFDYQRSYTLAKAVPTKPGDTVQVTCTYNPTLRQQLPQLRKLPPRYVTWGDGSSDEMCLAILQSTSVGRRLSVTGPAAEDHVGHGVGDVALAGRWHAELGRQPGMLTSSTFQSLRTTTDPSLVVKAPCPRLPRVADVAQLAAEAGEVALGLGPTRQFLDRQGHRTVGVLVLAGVEVVHPGRGLDDGLHPEHLGDVPLGLRRADLLGDLRRVAGRPAAGR